MLSMCSISRRFGNEMLSGGVDGGTALTSYRAGQIAPLQPNSWMTKTASLLDLSENQCRSVLSYIELSDQVCVTPRMRLG
jgi:hypothetical protein